ncbi:MAG: hypothetical protein R3F49_23490 [Planctomycetota bacterium]
MQQPDPRARDRTGPGSAGPSSAGPTSAGPTSTGPADATGRRDRYTRAAQAGHTGRVLRWVALGAALLAALVSLPKPAADTAPVDGVARALTVWSSGPLRIARADQPDYRAYERIDSAEPAAPGPAVGMPYGPAFHAAAAEVPTDARTLAQALDALGDPSERLVVARCGQDALTPEALPKVLAEVRRRADAEGELWLVILVELGAGADGGDRLRIGLEGPRALRRAPASVAVDPRFLAGRFGVREVEALAAAHSAGPAAGAPERWPRWLRHPGGPEDP